MEEFVVVVTGSRHWTNEIIIRARMKALSVLARERKQKFILVHGGAPGVDRMCAHWAKIFGAKVIEEKAEWNSKGYFDITAGLKRNILMLDKYKPNLVQAFRALGKSNGTDQCMKEARRRDITVEKILENSR